MKFLNVIFDDSTGGESKVFRAISEHYQAENLVIFDKKKNMVSEMIVYPMRFILNTLIKVNKDFGTFVSAIVSPLFLKRSYIRRFNFVLFNSSSMAIPATENLIAVVYTPPRALSDRYSDTLELIEARNKFYVPLFMISSSLLNAVYRISASNRKDLVCISGNVRERLRKYYGVDCRVVYPFINVNDYKCTAFSPFFLYVSRINPGKRQHLSIDAFKLFYEGKRSFRLVIAGTVDDTEHSRRYLEELKKMSLGFPVEFVFSPSNEEVREMYANCYLTLFSAQNEDFGLAPLESMASGKPVIALNEGGPKETIINGTTGFLVDDIEGMAERMAYLADNIEETISMGKRGREHVEKNFSPESFFTKIDRLIQSSLEKDKK